MNRVIKKKRPKYGSVVEKGAIVFCNMEKKVYYYRSDYFGKHDGLKVCPSKIHYAGVVYG